MTRSATTILLAMFLALPAFGQIKSINHDLVPAAGDEFVFVVAGDNRPTTHGAPYPRVFDTVISEIRLIHPDLVLWTGDTVYGYGDQDQPELAKEYKRFLDKAAYADVPIFNAPGNHEIHPQKPCDQKADLCEDEFRKHFGALYGSFDYRGAHFIAIDTEERGHTTVVDGKPTDVQVVDGKQLGWLTADVVAHKTSTIFAFFHTELTPAPNDEEAIGHPPLGNAVQLEQLFADNHVAAVFQGHEHLLYIADPRTTKGVRYYVAGGAGAPMYAQPENGGVSSYIVVRVKKTGATYTIVEPGRYYADPDPDRSDVVWLINSNDAPLPASRIEADLPASVAKCGAFRVAAEKLDGYKGQVDLVDCQPSAKSKGMNHITMKSSEDMPGRKSLAIDILPK